MTREDIIRMAREAGMIHPEMVITLERFAKLVAEHEREACAKLREMLHPFDLHNRSEMLGVMNQSLDDYQNLIRARGEQAQQAKPVAYSYTGKSTGVQGFSHHHPPRFTDVEQWDIVPLYTTPPQRKPLTDEEIALIVAECASSAHRHDDFSFARAIEEAHGIKENT